MRAQLLDLGKSGVNNAALGKLTKPVVAEAGGLAYGRPRPSITIEAGPDRSEGIHWPVSLVTYYQSVKHQNTSSRLQTGIMLPAARSLAVNVERLIARMSDRPARPDLAARIGIGDKTLGFIKAGTGNPTLENISKVAHFFRLQPWELLKPEESDSSARAPSQPVSGDLLMMAADAADEALKGLFLPKSHYWEIVAIAHDCIVDGMPFADVIDFLRPIASEEARKGAKNVGDSRKNLAAEATDGRRKASGNG